MKHLVNVVLCCCLCCCLLAVSARPSSFLQAPAQKKEILTNASVIELVKLGLSETIIIEKIRRSDRNFDTSVAGLKQLKAANVSETIISEMFAGPENSPATVDSLPRPTSSGRPTPPADPLVEQAAGVYVQTSSGMAEIHPSTFSSTKAGFMGTALTYGIKKSKVRAAVRGQSANTVIANSRPTFYFKFDDSPASGSLAMSSFSNFVATSPAEFVLIKMERKGNSREAVLMEVSAFGSSTGTREKDVVEFTFEKVKTGLFKVTPKARLDVGEYCFYHASSYGAAGLGGGKLFDFSVTLPAM